MLDSFNVLLKKLSSMIENIQKKICIFLVILLLSTVAVDVFLRSFLNYPIMGAQEVATWSFVWMIFMGGAAAFRSDSHFRMDYIENAVKGNKKKGVIVLIYIIVLLVASIIVKSGYDFSLMGLKRLSRPSGIVMFYLFISMPICGISLIIFSIEKLLLTFSNKSSLRRD